MKFDLKEHAHRRLNPLTGEWIQVSPHRSKRPWQGQIEKVHPALDLHYDVSCYLCPGNARSNGELNPRYESTFTFVNDFSAIVADVPAGYMNDHDLLVAKSEKGICKVICFSPKHNLTIPELSLSEIEEVVQVWMKEYVSLGQLEFIQYVQIFENKGEVMGCSNPHPHGQIWAQESIPVEPRKKHINQLNYYLKNGKTLLSDYLNLELKREERIVCDNDDFIVLVPFWATWPFETMILPKRPMSNIAAMTAQEAQSFASIYKEITTRYDNLFQSSFPYSAGIHQAPTDDDAHSEWHWHMVFYPPMLRSATIKKFMVGYEMLANPQRDITPEMSAAKLRATSSIHYKKSFTKAQL
jgi:UDPglucose--hexose-1-phosphate uridylyltransferase